jgi:hypothetical protein
MCLAPPRAVRSDPFTFPLISSLAARGGTYISAYLCLLLILSSPTLSEFHSSLPRFHVCVRNWVAMVTGTCAARLP